MKRASLRVFLAILFIIIASCAAFAASTTVEELLDDRTAFRWGKGFLAWVVHYPDYMVEPWVMEVTGGNGDPTGKIAEDFRKTLRMDTSTPVLLSVYVYGARGLSFAPLSRSFFLEKEDGTRFPPASYDKVFDSPISGLVQGLVFFPKVDGQFKLVLKRKNMPELVFEFPDDMKTRLREEIAEELKRKQTANLMTEEQKERISLEDAKKAAVEEAKKEWIAEREKLEKMLEEVTAQRDMLRKRLDDLMFALAEAKKKREEREAKPSSVSAKAPLSENEKKQPVGYEREKLLDKFLKAWQAGDLQEMYSLLSDNFKMQLGSAEELGKFLESKFLPTKFPLKYEIKRQDDPDEVVLAYAPKILFVRTLRSVRLKMEKVSFGWLIGALK